MNAKPGTTAGWVIRVRFGADEADAHETTDLLDEVIAAEVAHTATSMEVRLGIEVANLRGRNATLDALVKRLEAELADLVELRHIEAEAVAANRFYDQRDGYFEGLADGKG